MQSIKEHNLKANHNCLMGFMIWRLSVCNLSKNTIWKQITTTLACKSMSNVCMQSIKEHNLKANHNWYGYWKDAGASVCNLSKNTIWKQITTLARQEVDALTLYAIYQRTQSESKSQPGAQAGTFGGFCMQSIKEHNLKANHN